MDSDQLRQQLTRMRQAMFDEGMLNDEFIMVEQIEDEVSNPNFVENIIGIYISETKRFLDMLGDELEKSSPNLDEAERVMHKLRGGSSSMGAAKVVMHIDEMLDQIYKRDLDGVQAAYERAKAGYNALKDRFEPYAEILRILRMREEEEVADNEDDETESVDSNDVN